MINITTNILVMNRYALDSISVEHGYATRAGRLESIFGKDIEYNTSKRLEKILWFNLSFYASLIKVIRDVLSQSATL